MRRVLHILTDKERPFAHLIIHAQRTLPDCLVETIDWREEEPDLDALLERIFAADSVEVW